MIQIDPVGQASAFSRRTPSRNVAIIGFALLVGAVALAAASPPASSATAPVNRLANPSFEQTLTPWSGTNLQRVRLNPAPAGYYAARVSPVSGRMVIDDWPGEVQSEAGATYSAYMSLAAATSSSIGKPVTLVIREHTKAGAWVASWQTTGTLASGFQRLEVQGRAIRSGDLVDLYAYQQNVGTSDSFLADAAMLSVTAASPTPSPSPTSPTPSPTPTVSPTPTPTTSPTPTPTTSPTPTPTTSPTPTSTPPPPAPSGSTLGELSIDSGQAS
jgi:hypothetical protein